jgi:DNA-binding HxlR family transcriptional regulator
MTTLLSPIWKTEKSSNFTETVKSIDAECRNCKPITPLECINRCRVYKLKNELRYLWETMDNPDYIKELFNALKNETRLHILQAIVNSRCSVSQLQQELKKAGHSHSQANINAEYLRPLMAAGLATVAREEYYATAFGRRIIEQLGCFPEFADKLPTRSESYDETLLQSLLSGPKTFEEIKAIIPSKAVSRTLKRLRSARLIKTTKESSYIFFFKSKRDSSKDTLTATERRIYDTVAYEGIPAGKIAKETGLCLRRTYKFLRGLKGKKLIFARRIPKVYGLTCKGKNLASVMQNLQQIVEATWNSSRLVMQESKLVAKVEGLSNNAFIR